MNGALAIRRYVPAKRLGRHALWSRRKERASAGPSLITGVASPLTSPEVRLGIAGDHLISRPIGWSHLPGDSLLDTIASHQGVTRELAREMGVLR
jgi:hypothetical protein